MQWYRVWCRLHFQGRYDCGEEVVGSLVARIPRSCRSMAPQQASSSCGEVGVKLNNFILLAT